MAENKTSITPSQALLYMNKGKTVYGDTSDGHLTMKKANKTEFEISVYTNGQEQPEVRRGNIRSALKTLNREPFQDGLYLK